MSLPLLRKGGVVVVKQEMPTSSSTDVSIITLNTLTNLQVSITSKSEPNFCLRKKDNDGTAAGNTGAYPNHNNIVFVLLKHLGLAQESFKLSVCYALQDPR